MEVSKLDTKSIKIAVIERLNKSHKSFYRLPDALEVCDVTIVFAKVGFAPGGAYVTARCNGKSIALGTVKWNGAKWEDGPEKFSFGF